MMQQISMGAPDSRGDGLERDRLRASLDQQRAGGFERVSARFLGAQSLATCHCPKP